MNIQDDQRVQRGMQAQLAARRRRLDAGEAHIGWKIGFGAPAAMAKLGIAGPLIGFMTDRSVVASGAAVSISGWSKPFAETEIAVHIGKDLSAGAGREVVADAIAALGPAIELADIDRPPEDPEAILSGNIYHRHVILGRRDPSRAGARLDGWSGRVARNGKETARVTDLQANTGEILGLVMHVANTLPQFGEQLRRGDIIICGSIVPPMELRADDAEVAYSLEPGDWACSVRFEHR
ncbi:MAG: fumarylacetoacetate hydrolase family protein [Bradyrhizobiaceae bacterium]|nr:fumarylacetoacetate hydrolase family protein [Bradyrhizobiaceae bacterium]